MHDWIRSGDRSLLNTGEPTYTGYQSRTAPDVTVVAGKFKAESQTGASARVNLRNTAAAGEQLLLYDSGLVR